MVSVDWATIAAMTAVIATGGTIALVVLRAQLARYFVTRREYDDLDDRVEAIERRMIGAPTHEDIRLILDRLSEGKGQFSVMEARAASNGSAINRVERQLDILVRAQLERENSK